MTRKLLSSLKFQKIFFIKKVKNHNKNNLERKILKLRSYSSMLLSVLNGRVNAQGNCQRSYYLFLLLSAFPHCCYDRNWKHFQIISFFQCRNIDSLPFSLFIFIFFLFLFLFLVWFNLCQLKVVFKKVLFKEKKNYFLLKLYLKVLESFHSVEI